MCVHNEMRHYFLLYSMCVFVCWKKDKGMSSYFGVFLPLQKDEMLYVLSVDDNKVERNHVNCYSFCDKSAGLY